jgi:hypothetical protein
MSAQGGDLLSGRARPPLYLKIMPLINENPSVALTRSNAAGLFRRRGFRCPVFVAEVETTFEPVAWQLRQRVRKILDFPGKQAWCPRAFCQGRDLLSGVVALGVDFPGGGFGAGFLGGGN